MSICHFCLVPRHNSAPCNAVPSFLIVPSCGVLLVECSLLVLAHIKSRFLQQQWTINRSVGILLTTGTNSESLLSTYKCILFSVQVWMYYSKISMNQVLRPMAGMKHTSYNAYLWACLWFQTHNCLHFIVWQSDILQLSAKTQTQLRTCIYYVQYLEVFPPLYP